MGPFVQSEVEKRAHRAAYARQRRADGKEKDRRPCRPAKAREFRKRQPVLSYLADIKSKYGVTAEDYVRMLEQQGGGCAICGTSSFAGKNVRAPLTVDHDHKTERVRGLLCPSCNIGLGGFKDIPEMLIRAAAYLRASE